MQLNNLDILLLKHTILDHGSHLDKQRNAVNTVFGNIRN